MHDAVYQTKGAARRLVSILADREVRLSHSEALEVISAAQGARNWNTHRVDLTKAATSDPIDEHMFHALGLGYRDPEITWAIVMHLVKSHGASMWVNRASAYLIAALQVYFRHLDTAGQTPNYRSFRSAVLEFDRNDRGTSFLSLFRDLHAKDAYDPAILSARGVLDCLPGFSKGRMQSGDAQLNPAKDHAAYLTMQFSKALTDYEIAISDKLKRSSS